MQFIKLYGKQNKISLTADSVSISYLTVCDVSPLAPANVFRPTENHQVLVYTSSNESMAGVCWRTAPMH